MDCHENQLPMLLCHCCDHVRSTQLFSSKNQFIVKFLVIEIQFLLPWKNWDHFDVPGRIQKEGSDCKHVTQLLNVNDMFVWSLTSGENEA